MGAPPRIAVVDSTMIDLIACTARLPHAGETIRGEEPSISSIEKDSASSGR